MSWRAKKKKLSITSRPELWWENIKKNIYFVFSPFCAERNFFFRRTTVLALKQKRPPHNLNNDKIQRYACKLHIDYGAHKRLQKINAESHSNIKICIFSHPRQWLYAVGLLLLGIRSIMRFYCFISSLRPPFLLLGCKNHIITKKFKITSNIFNCQAAGSS